MSQVLTDNKVFVRYAFSREFIGQHWVKTGQFIGYGRDLELDCDTPEKRALIMALDWHDLSSYRERGRVNYLGKYRNLAHYRMEDQYYHDADYFDHELTIDEVWAEIKRMVSEKEADMKVAG